MSRILIKEMKLSASVLSYLFIAFGLMFFLPGYPVLCGAFFSCLGIFQSFMNTRETNDIVFSALLPVSKKDVVKGKFQFVHIIEMATFLVMAVAAAVRMTALSDSPVYRANALMNANLFALGAALTAFGIFNAVFIAGFFKTAYKTGKPFVTFIIIVFLFIGLCESLHHFPGLDKLNAFGFDNMPLQIAMLVSGTVLYAVLTQLAYRMSCVRFEKLDL